MKVNTWEVNKDKESVVGIKELEVNDLVMIDVNEDTDLQEWLMMEEELGRTSFRVTSFEDQVNLVWLEDCNYSVNADDITVLLGEYHGN